MFEIIRLFALLMLWPPFVKRYLQLCLIGFLCLWINSAWKSWQADHEVSPKFDFERNINQNGVPNDRPRHPQPIR